MPTQYSRRVGLFRNVGSAIPVSRSGEQHGFYTVAVRLNRLSLVVNVGSHTVPRSRQKVACKCNSVTRCRDVRCPPIILGKQVLNCTRLLEFGPR